MSMRGEFLYNGYMPGKGPVRVFQDMDNPKYVFAMLRSGQSIYTTREAIKARRLSNSATRKSNEAMRRESSKTESS